MNVTLRGRPPLISPNTLALPLLDRGRRARSLTRDEVAARWPAIEEAVERGDFVEAIAAMERLAETMARSTPPDPEEWRDALVLGRRVLYDDLARLGAHGAPLAARAALERCRGWDAEFARHLEALSRGLA